MERFSDIDELNDNERLRRFHNIMEAVIGIDDLFPPDEGVREPARPPRGPLYPRIGAIALDLQEKVLITL